MNKKIKQNRYKPKAGEKRRAKGQSISSAEVVDSCLKCIMIVVSITVLSLASIFTYDFITQTDFLNIKTIEISGIKQTSKNEILKLAGIEYNKNIFQINLSAAKKLIVSHPWIESADIKRSLPRKLIISIIEQKPLAVVKIDNLANILINTRGKPFKEYNHRKDSINNLPVITGVDLQKSNHKYTFNSTLFDSVMEFFKTDNSNSVKLIEADKNSGISIEASDIYNKPSLNNKETVQIKLGFSKFKAKLNKAVKISEYIDKNFPERTISTMDLFNIEKVFIKTKPDRLFQIDDFKKGA
ncbi:MAG: FtsQ-type POTRA domain-containing protein [Thermodesulfobacteriota bacterium]